MADFRASYRTVTTKTYSLPSPTNMVEVLKVHRAIEVDLRAKGIEFYDDTVTVEAYDDEVRFSYTTDTKEW